ncbi:MAG TPA: hypothetical protein VE135_11690 [Pyrinomonadaceae bacterium]|nr:hypothetical protein [Pyrinomonadaceae bacterium]
MKLLIGIVATALAALGIFSLMDEMAGKVKAPKSWTKIAQSRRSFLGLLISTLSGVIVGSWSWYANRIAKQELHLLFEVEVLLAQLEGLINVSIAQGSALKALQSIKVLVGKIGEYGFKASQLFSKLERQLPPEDYEELKNGAMAITVGLDTLDNMKPEEQLSDEITKALISMQSGIRLARTKTRELIDERTFNS